jgi:hypothetical protein
MYATSSTVMHISAPATNASFTTRVLHTGYGAQRWNRFLSSVSLTAAPFGFDAARNASIVARWWRGHARARANPTIAS